jgi:hypothetical protein
MKAPCLLGAFLAWALEEDLVQEVQEQALFSMVKLYLVEVL